MTTYSINPQATDRQLVGELDCTNIQRLINVNIPNDSRYVWLYPGFIKHVKRRHPGMFESHYHLIPSIIKSPDYIGKNPKEPNSIELYKQVDYFLLAIKVDPTGYSFVASFYDLHNGPHKIQKRLESGRIVPYTVLS